jgi:hypothetical protein
VVDIFHCIVLFVILFLNDLAAAVVHLTRLSCITLAEKSGTWFIIKIPNDLSFPQDRVKMPIDRQPFSEYAYAVSIFV